MHSSISGHLGCFHLLIFMYSAPVNMDVCKYLSEIVFNSYAYMPRIGTAAMVVLFLIV